MSLWYTIYQHPAIEVQKRRNILADIFSSFLVSCATAFLGAK